MEKNVVERKKNTSKVKKLILIIVSFIFILILAYFILNINKIKTMASYKKEEPRYMHSLTYYGDYKYDEYLKESRTESNGKARFIAKNVLSGVIPVFISEDKQCSTFVCRNKDGQVLFCRNFDLNSKSPVCFITTEGKNGYKNIAGTNLYAVVGKEYDKLDSLGINRVFLLSLPYFTLDGMNEYGLAISILSAGRAKTTNISDAVTLDPGDIGRLVIDKAKNIDEAVELIKSYNIDFGNVMKSEPYHYMIADSSGRSVVVEFTDGEAETVESPIVTNYNLIGKRYGVGMDRYDIIEETLTDNDYILSEEEALSLLERVCIKNKEAYSVIYNLTTGDVIAFARGDSSVTASFHLDLLEQ